MKIFQHRELLEAYKYVAEGGQALHLWTKEAIKIWKQGAPEHIPSCFQKTKRWAHLMDLDKERLVETAKRLGVKVIKVAQKGRRSQHIDLCGKPLDKAIKEIVEEQIDGL